MKVIVNHSGVCRGYFYKANVEVDLPQEVIDALGNSAKLVKQVKAENVKKQMEKASKDKMIKRAIVNK